MILTLVKNQYGNPEILHENDFEKWAKIAPGECIEVKAKKVRDFVNHARKFKMLSIVFENQEHFKDFDHMRYWLLCKAGYYDVILAPNGNKIYRAHSMDYASMDELKLREVAEKMAEVAVTELLTGLTTDELWREVEEQVSKLANYHGERKS